MTIGKTGLTEVQDQIQKFWSPMMTKVLTEDKLLTSLVNKDYEGEIREGGDTVYVSQIQEVEGQDLDISAGEGDTFTPQKLETKRIGIVANRRAVASVEISDLAKLQSQIYAEDSELRNRLVDAIDKKINDYLYSLVAPSAATPDHVVTGIATMNASNLNAIRTLTSQAKWPRTKPFYGLLDPVYYGDVLSDTTLANANYGATDAPIINGQKSIYRMGFNLLEDNSRSSKNGLFFYPDWVHLVIQRQIQFKLSDQHVNNKFSYLLSADVIYGAALGIDGNIKHITPAA